MGIHRKYFHSEVSPDTICGCCENVLYDPISVSPCGHYFCGECVYSPGKASTAHSKASASTSKSRRSSRMTTRRMKICPLCAVHLDYTGTTSPAPIPPWLLIKLDSLKLECPLECGQKDLSMPELSNHYVFTCLKSEQDCPNSGAGCKIKVTRLSVDQHLQDCLYRRVKCPVCSFETIQEDLVSHQIKKRCSERATRLEVIRALKESHHQVIGKNIELRDQFNCTMSEKRKIILEHWSNMGMKGFEKKDESFTPMGTPRFPRFYENLPICTNCGKYYDENSNYHGICKWHIGPIIQTYNGLCTACGKPSHLPGCVIGCHKSESNYYSD